MPGRKRPGTRTAVRMRRGAPTLMLNGKPVPAVLNFWSGCNYAPTPREQEAERRRLMGRMAEAGVHIFSRGAANGWIEPDVYDPSHPGVDRPDETIRQMVERVRAVDPDGYCLPRISTTPPASWTQRHRDQMEEVDGATDMIRQVSIASDLWLEQACQMLAAFVKHCESKPWGKRVFGYHFDGPSGEWCPRSAMIGQYGDYSPVMQACFRRWLREKYRGRVRALREAWNDRHVTFDTAEVPSPDRQRDATCGRYRDPRLEMPVIDYYHAVRDRTVHCIQELARALKRACKRQKIVGMFYGYEAATYWSPALFFGENSKMEFRQSTNQRSGHNGLSWVAACPDVDYIASPYDYLYRSVGGVGVSQSLPYACALRGKLFWTEDDTRTHTALPEARYGRTRTEADSVAVLRRNFAEMFTLNASAWWMEQSGRWFDSPGVCRTIAELTRLSGRLHEVNRRPSGEVAVVLDENAPFYTELENTYGWSSVFKQRLFGLARMGVPYRMHTLRDLELKNLPDYKLWVFLECHAIDRKARRLIQRRCKRDGNVAVFLHAAGLVDGDVDVANMTDLTGIKFRMREVPWEHIVAISNWKHPITRGLPRDMVYGTDRMCGPVLLSSDRRATELGLGITVNGANEPALVVKQFGGGARGEGDERRGRGDWASVYSGAPNLPGALLRGLARYAGCHVYCDSGDQILADRSFVVVHTAAGGPVTIYLPKARPVWDVFARRKLGARLSRIEADLPPRSTTYYHLGDRDLLAD